MAETLNHHFIPENARVVVLDWDDTIVGSIEAKLRQHVYVANKHFDIILNTDDMKRDWGKPLHQLIEKWYQVPADDETRYQAVFETVISYSSQFLKQPLPGASEVLRALKTSGYPLGVVTGSPRNDVYHDFSATGIPLELFDYFQTSDDSEFHKPDPRVFDPTNRWLDTIDVSPQQVLYMGDSLRDYEAARDAGYHFLGVETGANDLPSFYSAGALSIRAIGDLLKK